MYILKCTRAENLFHYLRAQLQTSPLERLILNGGGSEIANALSGKEWLGDKKTAIKNREQIQSWRQARNASLRSRGPDLNSLNHGQTMCEELKNKHRQRQ